MEPLESRLALAAVSGDFGWAGTFDPVPSAPDSQWYGFDSIAVDPTGNVYAVGKFSGSVDADPTAGVTTLTSAAGKTDAFVVKYGPAGGLVWARQLRNVGDGMGAIYLTVQVGGTGDVIISGTLSGAIDADPGAGTTRLEATGSGYDAFVVSLTSAGSFRWGRAFAAPSMGVMLADPAGNVYVGGSFSGTVDFDPGPGTTQCTSVGTSSDGFVVKLDANGGFRWVRQFESASFANVNFLERDNAGRIYAAGAFGKSIDIDPGPGWFGDSSAVDTPGSFVACLDDAGGFVGGLVLPRLDPYSVSDFHVDAGGNVYVVGTVSGTQRVADLLGPSAGNVVFQTTGDDDADAYVIKLTSAGTVAWARQFGSAAEYDHAWTITTDALGNVIVGGHFSGSVDFDPGPGVQRVTTEGGSDGFLLWLDAAGQFLSVRAYGGKGAEDAVGRVVVDAQGNSLITGGMNADLDMDPGRGRALLAHGWGAESWGGFLSKQSTFAAIGQAVGGVQAGATPAGYAVKSGSGLVPVSYAGRPASPSSPGAGWAVVGARGSGSGYEIFWRSASGSYGAWLLDAAGRMTSSRPLTVAEVLAAETQWTTDLTGDGKVGMAFTGSAPAVGNVQLGSTPLGYALRVGLGEPVHVTFGGRNASASNPGAGWKAIGGRAAAGGGFEVLWSSATGVFVAWTLDAGGRQTTARIVGRVEVLQLETEVRTDIDGDGEIGLPFVPAGSLIGTVQFGSTPLGYALRVGAADPVHVTFGGRNASDSNPGAGWKAIGGRAMGTGFELLWRGPTGTFVAWTLDAAGRQTGGRAIGRRELLDLETVAKTDIDGDGTVGIGFTPAGLSLGDAVLGSTVFGYAIRVGSAAPVEITSAGRNASASSPGGGWTAFAARTVGAGYEVLWRGPGSLVVAWTLDAAGRQTASRLLSRTDVLQLETEVAGDLDGDGTVGTTFTPIGPVFERNRFGPTIEGVQFGEDATGYGFKWADRIVYVQSAKGAIASRSSPGAGWVAVGGRADDGGYEVVWRGPGGVIGKWILGDWSAAPYESGRQVGSSLLTAGEVLELESEFDTDLNGDGVRGLAFAPFGPTGNSVVLGTTPLGYALKINDSTPVPVTYGGGVNASASRPGAGWTAVLARDAVGGIELLWRSAAGSYAVWVLDEYGRQISSRMLTLGEVYTIQEQMSYDLGVTMESRVDPPAAPAGLVATAGDGLADLSWLAVADGVVPVSGYVLQVSTMSCFCSRQEFAISGTSQRVPALTNGVTYYARVAAVNAAGTGAFSGAVTFTPRSPVSLPGQPQAVVVSPGSGRATVGWLPPADTGNSAITGYMVEYATTSWFTNAQSVFTSGTTADLTGLSNGVTYYVRVAARNAAGTGSFSESRSAMPQAQATVPGIPAGPWTTANDGSVTVSWSPPANTGNTSLGQYRLQVSTQSSFSSVWEYATLGTNYAVPNLTNGQTYYFRVAAGNSAGQGAFTAPASATPRAAVTVPGVPMDLGVSGGTVSWRAPSTNGNSPITGYTLQISTSSSFSSNVWTYPASGTSLSFQFAAGTTYYLRVAASNAAGTGSYGSTLQHTATPTFTAPNPVTNVRAEAACGNIVTLSWQRPSGGQSPSSYAIRVKMYAYAGGPLLSAHTINDNVSSGETSTTIVNVPANSYHVFEVVARNFWGDSTAAPSNGVTVPICSPSGGGGGGGGGGSGSGGSGSGGGGTGGSNSSVSQTWHVGKWDTWISQYAGSRGQTMGGHFVFQKVYHDVRLLITSDGNAGLQKTRCPRYETSLLGDRICVGANENPLDPLYTWVGVEGKVNHNAGTMTIRGSVPVENDRGQVVRNVSFELTLTRSEYVDPKSGWRFWELKGEGRDAEGQPVSLIVHKNQSGSNYYWKDNQLVAT